MKIRISQKITGLLGFYFLMALVAIGSTLFVSWHLESYAAAINEAGKERMRVYRIALLLGEHVRQPAHNWRFEIEQEVTQFERALIELRNGNPQRPLSLPGDSETLNQAALLYADWYGEIKPRIRTILDVAAQPARERIQGQLLDEYRPLLEQYVDKINHLVILVEQRNARTMTQLRAFQMSLIVVALVGTLLLDYFFSWLFVRPVKRLSEGLGSMGKADFSVRLPVESEDELGELAQGFNQMVEKLHGVYTDLEQTIEEKTRRLELKNRELGALYEVAAFLNAATAAEPLCDSVLERMIALFGASGGVVRLTDGKGEQLKVVAARGVSQTFLEEESYLDIGKCVCGEVARSCTAMAVDLLKRSPQPALTACSKDDFRSLAAIPIRSKQNMLGLFNLFFTAERVLPPSEIQLLESVGLHLGRAIENQRLIAREKEMAVSEERNLLAQELHDSIAQSLAFLNIQVQMLQEDLAGQHMANAVEVVEQIREGVQESYDDVRELLVHFRTRLQHADLDAAVANALEKFEGQVGIAARYEHIGPSLDLAPERVLQVLHILQESLSNVRKHAGASEVEVRLLTGAECRLVVQDNGNGFDVARSMGDRHVGIRIMRERAHRMGGKLTLESSPGKGARVILSWISPPVSTGSV